MRTSRTRRARASLSRNKIRVQRKPAMPRVTRTSGSETMNPIGFGKGGTWFTKDIDESSTLTFKPGDLVQSKDDFGRVYFDYPPVDGGLQYIPSQRFKIQMGDIGMVIDGPYDDEFYGTLFKVLFGSTVVVFHTAYLLPNEC